jgi:fibronectin type 3 domain-containing protein
MIKRILLLFAVFLASGVAAFGQATIGTHTVSLSWPAVASATGYNVYKAQSACPGATFAKITATPVTTPSFSESGLPDGATRCYYVTTVNAAGESTPSGTRQITTSTYTAPVAAAVPPPPSLTIADTVQAQ